MARKGDQNSSVRSTKRRIREGFIELMKEKTISEITVAELTSKVEISRGTFYTHYKDIYDLVEQLENEIFENVDQILETENLTVNMALLQIFDLLQKNYDLAHLFLQEGGDIDFIVKIRDLVSRHMGIILHDSQPKSKGTEDAAYFNSFMIYGFIGMAQRWLSTGMKQTPQEMADFASEFILSSIVTFSQAEPTFK